VDDDAVAFRGRPRENASGRSNPTRVDDCGQVDNLWVKISRAGSRD
jgi:hypothetical protein